MISENRLIRADNLPALEHFQSTLRAAVRCIYIDPPFNTGRAFTHYDDAVAHTQWLVFMERRLALMWPLLRPDGSIWVHCDDNEQAYLKVLMDRIFGRSNFVATVVWQGRYSRSNDASLSISHSYILIYAPEPTRFRKTRNRLPRTAAQARHYKNPDDDPRGRWRSVPWDAPNIRPNLSYPIVTPTGAVRLPPEGRCWSRTQAQWQQIVEDGRAYFGRKGDGAPAYKQHLDTAPSIVPNTWWTHEEAGHTDEAKREIHALFGRKNAFATPKPERLLHRVLTIATDPGDLVLDCFAGSGTTGAVAHKMGRRWIMIERGEHAESLIAPRLRKVIANEDAGGVTERTGWSGGGEFSLVRLP